MRRNVMDLVILQIVPTGREMIPAVLLFAEELGKDPIQKN